MIRLPTRAFMRISSSRAMASTMKVMTNRMQAERDQRRGVEVADRFGEFVGDGRGDGRAGRQDRAGDAVRIADHEGDRHGLAERAAQAPA